MSGGVQEIERHYHTLREGADSYKDQELARLFVQAKDEGKNQEWIAQRMGKSQKWVSTQLLFGRFLIYTGRYNSFSPPKPVTEWRFRENWRAVPKHRKDTEEDRFAKVLERLKTDQSETPKNLVKKPGIKKAVIEAPRPAPDPRAQDPTRPGPRPSWGILPTHGLAHSGRG